MAKKDIITHSIGNKAIMQRNSDGYMNATKMCSIAGKKIHDYKRLDTTQDFIDVLESETGIPASELIQTLKGGDLTRQGTWVHPRVAIHLAQWLSPEFAVKVSQWVFDWMNEGKAPDMANNGAGQPPALSRNQNILPGKPQYFLVQMQDNMPVSTKLINEIVLDDFVEREYKELALTKRQEVLKTLEEADEMVGLVAARLNRHLLPLRMALTNRDPDQAISTLMNGARKKAQQASVH
ncbi:MAG: KilA-N domain-containing protein [bacterium]